MLCCLTRANRLVAFAGSTRTQPCEAGEPRRRTANEPWIAWPESVKKIECGIGALSYFFEKWLASMLDAWNVPFGVLWPRRPVETFHCQRVTPSTWTVISWLDLSTVISTAAPAGDAPRAASAIPPARIAARQRMEDPVQKNHDGVP